MLDEAGASIVINNSADETYEAGLRSTLMRIMANFSILGEIAKCSKSLCDGRGVERVVFGLINHKRSDFQVRKATIDDLDLYHSWRNEPTTRKWSFNSDHIAFDIHAEWFRHKCSSPNALLFVMTERNGLEVGQIRFERELGSSAESIVSFSLDPMARGKRLSTVLIELGLEKVKMSWPNLSTCLAQVKLGNHSSVRALKLAGFKPLPSIEDGIINLLFRF
jgi:RimJ/RimL family protein N-acetyltransferase